MPAVTFSRVGKGTSRPSTHALLKFHDRDLMLGIIINMVGEGGIYGEWGEGGAPTKKTVIWQRR